jgi:ABC-type dipeptide/oligopeptide/nickel transport system permease component
MWRQSTCQYGEVNAIGFLSSLLFLFTFLWAITVLALSFTRNVPTTSLLSMLTKPRADQQEVALEQVRIEVAQKLWTRFMRLVA